MTSIEPIRTALGRVCRFTCFVLVSGALGCSTSSDRAPYYNDGDDGRGGITPPTTGGPGSPGGDSSEAGGRGNSSNGGSSSSGGGNPSGGSEGQDVTVRVAAFDIDFSFEASDVSASGTVAAKGEGDWQEVDYAGAPIQVPLGTEGYRFEPKSASTYMTTFTIAFPDPGVGVVGAVRRMDVLDAYNFVQPAEEPDPERAQLVVFVHDEFGQPLTEVVPDVSGARQLLFRSLQTWSVADRTTVDGLIFAGNIDAEEFRHDVYEFSLNYLGEDTTLTVPMAADALTFVDVTLTL